nr:hypothetical protein [Edwardsiella ictaluri]
MAPNLYTGQQVRLGGRVINVINLPKTDAAGDRSVTVKQRRQTAAK